MTPPDPITAIGLAIPLLLLYKLSIITVRFTEKNKSENLEDANLKDLRKNLNTLKKKFKNRNVEFNINNFNKIDSLNRNLISKKEKLEQEKKILSKSQNKSNFSKSKKISEDISSLSKKQYKAQEELNKIIFSLPN